MSSQPSRTLFITPQYLVDNTVINNNTEQSILVNCIRRAEDKYLMPGLGSQLYQSLISQITANTISGNYKILLDDYVIPTLLDYSLLEYIPFTFKFRNKGIMKQSSPDSVPADLTDLGYITDNVRDNAQFYMERMIRFLRAQGVAVFPEYFLQRTTDDIMPASGDYFSGIQFPFSNRNDYTCNYGKGYTTDLNW